MGDRDGGGEGGQRPSEGARRVALDDEQAGPVGERGGDRLGDMTGVRISVIFARAFELDALVAAQPVRRRVDRMLAGQKDARRPAAVRQGGRDGRKLDRFWTGTDNDVDPLAAQPSP